MKTKGSIQDVIDNILPFLKYLQSVSNKKEGLTFVESKYCLTLNLPSGYLGRHIFFKYDGTNFTSFDFFYKEDLKRIILPDIFLV